MQTPLTLVGGVFCSGAGNIGGKDDAYRFDRRHRRGRHPGVLSPVDGNDRAALQREIRLTIVHGDIQELIRNNLADLRQPQVEAFLPLLRRLKAAGCDCAALTSLGAHFCFDELSAVSPLPLVSAVSPLDDYFASKGISRIGLLGTRVVMRTRLFGQLARTQVLALDDEIEPLGQTYQDIAVSGVCTPEQRAVLLDAGRRMIATGAEVIVLAGTDLNLAFDDQQPGYPVLDALDVHVDRLADLAVGRGIGLKRSSSLIADHLSVFAARPR